MWDHCASPLLHCSYLLASKIGVFRQRSLKEESASCEEMVLRKGLLSAGENGNYLEAWKTYTIFATQISKHGVVVQLVRIPACHAGGRGFESRPYRQRREHSESCALFLYRCLSHLDSLRCHLLQVYSSLLFTLRDVWDGGVCWDNKLTLRR